MSKSLLSRAGLLLALAATLLSACSGRPSDDMPRYQHIFVIIEENHTFDQVMGNVNAPTFNRLAKDYGVATEYYGVQHPSEPNYVAILGGSTFGISDDDAYFCKPGMEDQLACAAAGRDHYPSHTVTGRSLMDQLDRKHLTWKGYFQSIPAPGALVNAWPPRGAGSAGDPAELYMSKHNAFMTFKKIQNDKNRAKHIVGFDALDKDIVTGHLPNFAEIIPNQCNDMHGLHGPNAPPDCRKINQTTLIARGDRTLAAIMAKLMTSRAWTGDDNTAIVITFDESDSGHTGNHPRGCCGSNPKDRDNPGGGWIPTIVVTNHGPRGVIDPTPYNHFSLLRTIEAAFGIHDYLRHAGDKKVVVMKQLFAVSKN